MTALIKTLNHENLGKKRITNTKNFVHEIVLDHYINMGLWKTEVTYD